VVSDSSSSGGDSDGAGRPHDYPRELFRPWPKITRFPSPAGEAEAPGGAADDRADALGEVGKGRKAPSSAEGF
jgi:hypothetical protein